MSQIKREFIEDGAINNTKLDKSDSYTVTSLTAGFSGHPGRLAVKDTLGVTNFSVNSAGDMSSSSVHINSANFQDASVANQLDVGNNINVENNISIIHGVDSVPAISVNGPGGVLSLVPHTNHNSIFSIGDLSIETGGGAYDMTVAPSGALQIIPSGNVTKITGDMSVAGSGIYLASAGPSLAMDTDINLLNSSGNVSISTIGTGSFTSMGEMTLGSISGDATVKAGANLNLVGTTTVITGDMSVAGSGIYLASAGPSLAMNTDVNLLNSSGNVSISTIGTGSFTSMGEMTLGSISGDATVKAGAVLNLNSVNVTISGDTTATGKLNVSGDSTIGDGAVSSFGYSGHPKLSVVATGDGLFAQSFNSSTAIRGENTDDVFGAVGVMGKAANDGTAIFGWSTTGDLAGSFYGKVRISSDTSIGGQVTANNLSLIGPLDTASLTVSNGSGDLEITPYSDGHYRMACQGPLSLETYGSNYDMTLSPGSGGTVVVGGALTIPGYTGSHHPGLTVISPSDDGLVSQAYTSRWAIKGVNISNVPGAVGVNGQVGTDGTAVYGVSPSTAIYGWSTGGGYGGYFNGKVGITSDATVGGNLKVLNDATVENNLKVGGVVECLSVSCNNIEAVYSENSSGYYERGRLKRLGEWYDLVPNFVTFYSSLITPAIPEVSNPPVSPTYNIRFSSVWATVFMRGSLNFTTSSDPLSPGTEILSIWIRIDDSKAHPSISINSTNNLSGSISDFNDPLAADIYRMHFIDISGVKYLRIINLTGQFQPNTTYTLVFSITYEGV